MQAPHNFDDDEDADDDDFDDNDDDENNVQALYIQIILYIILYRFVHDTNHDDEGRCFDDQMKRSEA